MLFVYIYIFNNNINPVLRIGISCIFSFIYSKCVDNSDICTITHFLKGRPGYGLCYFKEQDL